MRRDDLLKADPLSDFLLLSSGVVIVGVLILVTAMALIRALVW